MDPVSVAASAGAWAWNEFGKDQKGGFGDFLKRKFADVKDGSNRLQDIQAVWMGFQWDGAADRYRNHLQKLYGQIRILGSSEPIDLDELFTDVYILEKPQAFRIYDIAKLHEFQKEPEKLNNDKRMPGLRIVHRKKSHRLYLLGKPGAGKTTFLKFLVYATLQGKLNKLPIFVTIKDWASSGLDLPNFIVRQFGICQLPAALPFIEYLLESGRALVLCDGLDEAPQEDRLRERLTNGLRDFCNQYLRTQVIITCRVAASDYTFTEFTYLEMADFDDDQVKTYARKWFQKANDRGEDFISELAKPENQGVRDLGHSPLLLSMICLTYDATLHIPQRRVELYEEALEALLKKWDASRNIRRDEAYHKLSLGRKRQMFARLAAETFEKGEILFLEKQMGRLIEDYLKGLPSTYETGDDPDGVVILRAIAAQHGIFVERAQGIYAFAHLTFQEYYTSKNISENIGRGSLKVLMQHIGDSRWQEIFLLTASLLDDASEFFFLIQDSISSGMQSDSVIRKTLIDLNFASSYIPSSHLTEGNPKIHGFYLILNSALHGFNTLISNSSDISVDINSNNVKKKLSHVTYIDLIKINPVKVCLETSRNTVLITIGSTNSNSEIILNNEFNKVFHIFKYDYEQTNDLHENFEKLSRIREIIKAHLLLINCMKVAYVTDRDAILNKILNVD